MTRQRNMEADLGTGCARAMPLVGEASCRSSTFLGPETVPTGPADAAVRCRCTSTLSLDIQTKCVHLVITIAVRVAEMEKGIESSEI
jgi:hypothetical protein